MEYTDEKPAKEKATDDEIIADAKARFKQCQDNDGGRADSLAAFRFVDENQHWDEADLRQRTIDGRPALTTNLLSAFVRQVVNDARQNEISIKVHPVGNGATDEVADVYAGLIRHIEYDSGASAAYVTSLEHAVKGGFGYFRLLAEYTGPDSFDQKLAIKRVRNPFSTMTDPMATEADSSDMQFALISETMSRAAFKMEYPKATATDDQIGRGIGDANGWITGDACRVCEFYRIEKVRKTLVMMSDGTTRYSDDRELPPEGVLPVATRETLVPKVMWYKLTACEVLERAEIPCRWIPVFPVYGNESDLDGRINRKGLVNDAMDPCRMYDYWLTAATEEIALRTKTPFIGAAGQFEGFEEDWTAANRKSIAYLEYNPVTLEGALAPPPSRQPPADVPSGFIAMSQIARDNIKAVTGIFDASLGSRSNETSGKAILARQREGDTSTFNFPDNLARSVTHLGRCMVDMIPKIYDTERMQRILEPDGTARTVTLNERLPQPKMGKDGAMQAIANDMTLGDYAVAIDTGPAYTTLRQEAADSMLSVGQSWPRLFEVAGDKVIRAMGWPNAGDIADRVAKGMPPGLVEKTEGGENEPMVMVGDQSVPIEQAAKMIADMQAALEQAQQELERFELGLQKAEIDAQSRIQVAQINAESREEVAELQGQVDLLVKRMDDAQAAMAAAKDMPAPVATQVEPQPRAETPDIGPMIAQIAAALNPPRRKVMEITAPSGQVFTGQVTDDPEMGE